MSAYVYPLKIISANDELTMQVPLVGVVSPTTLYCVHCYTVCIPKELGAMSVEARRQLLQRLQKVVKDWPEDPSRKGRDFGEFLRNTYMQRFEEDLKNDVRATSLV